MAFSIASLEKEFTEIAAAHGAVSWTTEYGFIKQAYLEKPELAQSTEVSQRNAILNIARTGITIAQGEGMAFLDCRNIKVEKKGQKPTWRRDAAFRTTYRGMSQALYDCGAIDWIRADVVREGDVFIYKGPFMLPEVAISDVFGQSRLMVVGSYAVAQVTNPTTGKTQHFCEVLRPEELAAMEKASNGSFAWKGAFGPEMMKKSAINRIGKTIPRPAGSRADLIIKASAQGDAVDFSNLDENAPQQAPAQTSQVAPGVTTTTPNEAPESVTAPLTEQPQQEDQPTPESVTQPDPSQMIDVGDMMDLEAECRKVGMNYSQFMDWAGTKAPVIDGVLQANKSVKATLIAKLRKWAESAPKAS